MITEESLVDVIRQKEKELRDVNELRYANLSQLLSEKEKLFIDSNKRLEHLKEDFQYNLTLLDARDDEISRLESLHQRALKELSVRESEIKILLSRVEIAERKESESREALSREQQSTKVK